MKKINLSRSARSVLVLAVSFSLTASLSAQEAQRQFASPADAIKALTAAAQSGDKATLHEIFGPDIDTLMTGDPVQDQANFKGFTQAMTDSCVPAPDGNDRYVLNIGTNDWPFPIPLVKTNDQWIFDTAAGKEEIINRHIGRDELDAIGVCRAYVTAQNQYFSQEHDGSGAQKYALKFKSTPGKQDGLYWDGTNGPSPFGALVADAHVEGYTHDSVGNSVHHPFHGYFFHILTSQGRAASGGKKDYLVNGDLTGGFALVAYPEVWGKSGIMTFIVNQDGQVYQRNFGPKTAKVAASLNRYNPDSHWSLVSDQGINDISEIK